MNARMILAAAALAAFGLARPVPALAVFEGGARGCSQTNRPYAYLSCKLPGESVRTKAADGKIMFVKSHAGMTCTSTVIPLAIWPFSDSKESCTLAADADAKTLYEVFMKDAVEHSEIENESNKLKMFQELLCRKAGDSYQCRLVVHN